MAGWGGFVTNAACRGCGGSGRVTAARAGCYRCGRSLADGAAVGSAARACRFCDAVNYLPTARPSALCPCPSCRGTGRLGTG